LLVIAGFLMLIRSAELKGDVQTVVAMVQP